MGYSATVAAVESAQIMVDLLKSRLGDGGGGSNTWGARQHFIERGRENDDGAYTGTVYGPSVRGPGFAHRLGTARVEPDGRVTRWPTSIKSERDTASAFGAALDAMLRASISSVA